MSKNHVPTHYSKPMIVMHWLTVLLVASVYALMEFKGIFPKNSAGREAMKDWHFTLGMTVFVMTWLRMIFRLTTNPAPILPAPAQWQLRLSKALHLALYAMLILLPFSGWLMVSAAGGHVFFWSGDLPSLVGANKDLADSIKDVHETVANVGYGLIGLHALAALLHHYVFKDNTLLRMLPKR